MLVGFVPVHLSLNRGGRWGKTDDFTTNFHHFSLFSSALWDLANSKPFHSPNLSSHLFFCLACLLAPFTVPRKMVLARPYERETRPYHFSLRLSTTVRRSLCGPIACWILARTSSLVTWSLYEMSSILLSFQTGFNLFHAVVVCAILQSISGLEPSSDTTEPRYLKFVTMYQWVSDNDDI